MRERARDHGAGTGRRAEEFDYFPVMAELARRIF